MKKLIFRNKGFVGLLIVLMATTILFIIAWELNMFSKGGSVQQTGVAPEFQVMDKAGAMKDSVEQRYR